MGAPEHLARYRREARALVVTVLPGRSFPNFDPAEHGGLGDFVVVTDPSLPRAEQK
jgi:hypothetical protein